MLKLESRIDTVTLYHLGATVRRVADVVCPDGRAPLEVQVPGLPLSLFDGTVRVRVEGLDNDRAEVVATHVRVGLHVPPRQLPLDTPDAAELRRLRRALAVKQETLAQLDREVEMLAAVEVPDRPQPEEGKAPPPSPMTSRVALEQFLQDGTAARVTEVRNLRDQVKELEEQAAAVERKLALASSAKEVKPHELSKCVTAALQHTGGNISRARLVLEYYVQGARWAPAYQCRMTRDCRKADLSMRALICQRSGEDWKGVRVLLSTAAPMTWTELPELSSVRLGKAQPPLASRRGFRPAPQGAEALFADHDRDRAALRALAPAAPEWAPPSVDLAPAPVLSMPAPSRDKGGAKRRKMAEREMSSGDMDDSVMMECEAAPEEVMAPAAALSMPPPAPPPTPMMGPPSAKASAMRMPSPAPRPGAAPAKPVPSRPQLEVVVFAHLRLSGADDGARRNRLEPLDPRRAYLDSLRGQDLVVNLDVMQVVASAEQQGAEVQSVPLPAGAVDVRAVAGNFDYAYPADLPVDVPSDGVFHSVALGTRTADADVLYVAVPREEPNVYRQASIRNPLAAPLLSGPAEVYVGGEYVLATTLPTVPAEGDFRLGLGVEQAIKCARNTHYKELRSGTKIVATTELQHDVVIDLVNNLERDIHCEVRERIPQPAADAEVVVEEGKVDPAWEAYSQEERSRVLEGGRRWRVAVKAGKTVQLKAQYVVKLYANNEIVGGNRREA